MRPVRVGYIGQDGQERHLVEMMLANLAGKDSSAGKTLPFAFELRQFSPRQLLDRNHAFERSTFYVLPASQLSLARQLRAELQGKDPHAFTILLYDPSQEELYHQARDAHLVDDGIKKPFRRRSLEKIIGIHQQQGTWVNPWKVLVIGGGRLGLETLKQLSNVTEVEKLGFYSERMARQGYAPLRTLVSSSHPDIDYYGSLEEAFSAQPDLAIVASAAHTKRFNGYATRAEALRNHFQASLPIHYNVFHIAQETAYRGLFNVLPNPPGAVMRVAKLVGIPEERMTSTSPDPWRDAAILSADIYQRTGRFYNPNSIHLALVGEHGQEMVINRLSTVEGQPISQVLPEFRDTRIQRGYEARHFHPRGIEVMHAAEDLGVSNYDAPWAATQAVRRFTRDVPVRGIYVPLYSGKGGDNQYSPLMFPGCLSVSRDGFAVSREFGFFDLRPFEQRLMHEQQRYQKQILDNFIFNKFSKGAA